MGNSIVVVVLVPKLSVALNGVLKWKMLKR